MVTNTGHVELFLMSQDNWQFPGVPIAETNRKKGMLLLNSGLNLYLELESKTKVSTFVNVKIHKKSPKKIAAPGTGIFKICL